MLAWHETLDQEWANSKTSGPLPSRGLKRVKDEDDDAGSVTKKPKKAGDMTDADVKTLYATNKLHTVSGF